MPESMRQFLRFVQLCQEYYILHKSIWLDYNWDNPTYSYHMVCFLYVYPQTRRFSL